MIEKTVVEYSEQLQHLGIEHSIVEHTATPKIADILASLHLTFSDCAPTLIMKGDGRYYAVVSRGDCKVDFKKLKKELHLKDLRMATQEEFTSFTGLPVGAARIYTPEVAQTIIDEKVFEQAYLMGGSGVFDCSIQYRTADLKKIPNVVILPITQ